MNEYLWSIVIEQDLVQAAIWTVRDGNVFVISTSKPAAWGTDEDLLQKTDEALSEAIADFPDEQKEPSKTVFGVPASWVEDGGIKKPHLDKIRVVSQRLSLTPTGFVVLPEAIAHSVKVKEGSPLSGVIVGVGAGSLDLTVFRLGNIVGTVSVGRSGSLVEDMVEGLSRFSSTESVPTRWLLYDGLEVNLEETKQELLKIDWNEVAPKLKFLHTPQVEIVAAVDKAEAVSIAGASEMGEVKGIEGESNVAETNDLSPEDLGFVIDKDMHQMPGEQKEEIENQAFTSKKKVPILSSIAAFFGELSLKRPRAAGRGSSSKVKRIVIIFIVLLVLSIAGVIFAWLNLVSAEIAIYISPKNLQESEVILLDRNVDTADTENFIFPANLVNTEVTSEKSKNATGSLTVGDKAKGKINIRNGTADTVDFGAGTTLVGPNDLEFVLDEGVSVPEAQSPTTPGTASVSVTASDIGADYNLARDEGFSVANYPKSEIDAVAEEEFTGGSSREITAVSQDDIDGLRETLRGELEKQVISRLKSEAANDRFIEDGVRYVVRDEILSASAGDEADSVSLSMTLFGEGLVLGEMQIQELSQAVLEGQIPDGFSLKSEQVDVTFDLIDEAGDGVWEFDVNLSANLLPSIDVDKVKSELAGKTPQGAESYLSQIPGYVRSVMVIDPTLPGFFGNVPRRSANISVEIIAER